MSRSCLSRQSLNRKKKTVHEIFNKSDPKTCDLGLIPSFLLFECLDTILPTLTAVTNKSITSSIFPQVYKAAIVKPLLKKGSLDHNDLKNFLRVQPLLCFKDHRESHPLSALQPSIYLSAIQPISVCLQNWTQH